MSGVDLARAEVFIVEEVRVFDLGSIGSTLDVVESFLSAAALVLGAIWAYIKFFRGRVFKPRLELSVAGSRANYGTAGVITAVVSLKNCGLTRVKIRREGTLFYVEAATVSDRPSQVEFVRDWTIVDIESTLVSHAWVEPGEPIDEPHVIILPDPETTIYRISARVVDERRFSSSNEWNARAIVANQKED